MGEPLAFSLPRTSGAQPLLAIENNIRDEMYKAAFAPDNAAVSTTKFMTWLAAGILTDRNTVTNGLSVTPARLHGMMPTNTTIAPRYTVVRTAAVIHAARATSLGDLDSPEVTATNSTPPKA